MIVIIINIMGIEKLEELAEKIDANAELNQLNNEIQQNIDINIEITEEYLRQINEINGNTK